tara:strand:- start:69 stop:1013 length:945 start_codon:yes stop_codon:yes gene_type:complete
MAAAAACPPRSIYVDLGVNWCNTLDLYRRVAPPERRAQPWLVIGWEASPLIVPYADACVQRINAGLPAVDEHGSLPPTGSSAELVYYVTHHASLNRACGHLVHNLFKLKACTFSHPELVANLSALPRPDSALQKRTTIESRLRHAAGCPLKGSQHFLVPAAAGAENGSIELAGGLEQMFLGGSVPMYWRRGVSAYVHPNKKMEFWTVPQVDVVEWLRTYVREEDYLVLKSDVEGGEHFLMPALLDRNVSHLVDVLLWECHYGVTTNGMPSKCWRLCNRMQAAGMHVFSEPKTCHSARSKWDCFQIPDSANASTC